jgi:hypothetical protein
MLVKSMFGLIRLAVPVYACTSMSDSVVSAISRLVMLMFGLPFR